MRAGTSATTSFVGRRRELAALSRLLRSTRLLTITGIGGSGKTRLARAVVDRLVDGSFAWVDLASLREPSAVAPAIERAIGVHADGTLTTDALAEALRVGPRVVVLDNCELLTERCRDAAARLLDADGRVKILATSRVPFGLGTELVWPIPPLSLPPSDGVGIGNGIRADAVRLFVERARSAQPTFALDASTAGLVDGICRRLDGLPLAIELAAARLRHMSLVELSERLGALRLFDQSDAERVRHRTMTAALDWSYEQLRDDERLLLRRVAVFAGGFTIAGAEAVSGSEIPDVLTALSSLVDGLLVGFSPADGRYRLLEPVREYAEERLLQHGEMETATRHAARHLVTLATDTLGTGRGVPRADLLIRAEFPNAAAVMPWLLRNDPSAALRLMTRFAIRYRSAVPVHLSVVRTWLERGLDAHRERDSSRADALYAWAFMAWSLDQDGAAAEPARAATSASLAIAEEIGDDRAVAQARLFLAILTATYGPLDEALDLYDDVIPTLVDPRMLALAYSRRAVLRQLAGDAAGAQADLRDAFAAWDRGDDALVSGRALTILCAAEILFLSGRPTEAIQRAREAIAAQRSSAEPLEAAPFVALAHLAAVTGDDERALRLAGVADRLKRDVGSWLERRFQLTDGSWLARLEDRLGERAARLRAEGRGMPSDLAVAYALGERTSTGLTRREEEVARLVAEGLTDKEIGAHLSISDRTAENHVQRVRDKLGLRSRAQIARWVSQRVANAGVTA